MQILQSVSTKQSTMNVRKFFEYAYLGVFALSVYEAIRCWNLADKQSFYMYVFFAVASLGMFFIRRQSRKRNENKESKNP